jgi:transposase
MIGPYSGCLGKATLIMGGKQRHFAPLINVSLEELVPQDHFYRHLERTLDLSFVREFVRETYAGGGRPSIDPVVFFKLQLVMFFEGLRSERQLMRHAADRLSVRWYVGYDLGEPLPDHSSLTKIRTRYGLEVFRRFFDAIVEQCQNAGLVWGRELNVDGTKVAANAGKESVKPRFAVEAHLSNLFGTQTEEPGRGVGTAASSRGTNTRCRRGASSADHASHLTATRGKRSARPAQCSPSRLDRARGSAGSPREQSRVSTHRRLSGEYHRSRCNVDAK